jgi:hypothetical protein
LKHGKLFTRTSPAKLRCFGGDSFWFAPNLTRRALATEHHSKRLPRQPQFSRLQFIAGANEFPPHAGSAFPFTRTESFILGTYFLGFAMAESFLKFARFMILWL